MYIHAYTYMHAITTSKKEAMNSKDSVEEKERRNIVIKIYSQK